MDGGLLEGMMIGLSELLAGYSEGSEEFGPSLILAHLPMPLSQRDNGWPHTLSKNFHKHPLKSFVIFFSSRLHEPVIK